MFLIPRVSTAFRQWNRDFHRGAAEWTRLNLPRPADRFDAFSDADQSEPVAPGAIDNKSDTIVDYLERHPIGPAAHVHPHVLGATMFERIL